MTRTFDEVAWNWLELTSTDTLGVVTLAEKTVNTTDGESKTRLGRTAVKYELVNAIRIAGVITREWREKGDQNIRLRVLAAAGLAAGFASSHFEFGDVMRLTRKLKVVVDGGRGSREVERVVDR
jgi:hypothetical protein